MKTNLKLELFKACIFMLIGAFLCKQFEPKQEVKEVSQSQESECKVIVKKVTKPDGTIDEVTEFLAKNSQKQVIKVKKNKYLAGLKYEYDFKDQQKAYELSLGRKVTDNLSLVFSYNTKQVAGIGVMVEF